jgi:mersacidin/lichenicidin family type 2 lantibiotic
MSGLDVVRAWKDPVYRAGLAAAALAELPDPVASVGVTDAALSDAYGMAQGVVPTTFPTCTMTTWKKGCCP